MRQNAKWFVIGGSALVILGFFLPIISVSVLGFGTGFSLSVVASLGGNQTSLYLILLGAIATLILAFLPSNSQNQSSLFLIGQVAGLGLGVLIILIMLLTASSWASTLGVSNYVSMFLSPGIGAFALILGYGLAGVGLFIQFVPFVGQSFQRTSSAPSFPSQMPGLAQAAGARLEFVQGNLSGSLIPIQGDINIGRSRDNQVQLTDLRVSRLHARIRYAQGAWFIQDQNSTAGTWVNRKRITATRLNPGDQITIGDTTFIFHA